MRCSGATQVAQNQIRAILVQPGSNHPNSPLVDASLLLTAGANHHSMLASSQAATQTGMSVTPTQALQHVRCARQPWEFTTGRCTALHQRKDVLLRCEPASARRQLSWLVINILDAALMHQQRVFSFK